MFSGLIRYRGNVILSAVVLRQAQDDSAQDDRLRMTALRMTALRATMRAVRHWSCGARA
jgi:hypothetical protein